MRWPGTAKAGSSQIFRFDEDWPAWEIHPQGDEFVYLLSGAVELHLDKPGRLAALALEGSVAALVPRGVRHTAKVHVPSRMLFVTRGAGTVTRPAWARRRILPESYCRNTCSAGPGRPNR